MSDDDLLAEQQAYYRARAPEYDDVYAQPDAPLGQLGEVLPWLGTGDVLELACGTGQWTGPIAAQARSLTAVDGSEEVIAIARTRSADSVRFVQADLFTWEPDTTYDTVFFGFWLSHVPRPRWAAFWELVRRALRPGGAVVLVDQQTVEHMQESIVDADHDVVRRTLSDGRTFDIVRVPLTPASLTAELDALGWDVETKDFAGHFLAARCTPRTQWSATSGRP